MVNYKMHKVEYQVVSGIKFNLQYLGNDGLTSVHAMVMVDLEMEPFLLGFQVRCLAPNVSAVASTCTDGLAYQIFSACESLMLVHPELLAYELVSMVSDDSEAYDGLLFILTYQNHQNSTRVLAEVNVAANVFSVMSYYKYAYPS